MKLCASTDLQKQQREKVPKEQMEPKLNSKNSYMYVYWQVVIVLKEWHDAFDIPNLAL
ncbi:unnamed protein product [Brassica rapa subsp. narinosa]